MKHSKSLTAMAVAAGLFLVGCTNQTDGPAETSPTETSEASEHNRADVEFAQQMIPHHEQALRMAKVASSRAESKEVKDLAADIEAAQEPEIQMMTGWLKEWGEDVPRRGDDHMMDDGSMMDGDGSMMEGDGSTGKGMMSDEDMAELGKASGGSFDRMFLTMMIRHHEGAIVMAEEEQRDGKNSEVIALAEQIESAQTAEIKLMRDLLAE